MADEKTGKGSKSSSKKTQKFDDIVKSINIDDIDWKIEWELSEKKSAKKFKSSKKTVIKDTEKKSKKPNINIKDSGHMIDDIGDLDAYIQKRKESSKNNASPQLNYLTLEWVDIKDLEKIYAIVPHKKWEHKLVWFKDDQPEDLWEDDKWRTKWTEYIKNGTKIYNVHVDFKRHSLHKNQEGNRFDVWLIDEEDDLKDQIKAIKNGMWWWKNFEEAIIIWKKIWSKKEISENELKNDKLKEDKLKEDKLKEDKLKEDKLKEDKLKEDKLKEDKLKEDKLKEDKLKEDKLKEDKLKEEKLKEDKLKEEKLKEDKLKEEKLKEDKLKEDKLKEDKLKEEKLKEEKLKEDKLKEDKLKEDKLKEDKLKEEKLKEESSIIPEASWINDDATINIQDITNIGAVDAWLEKITSIPEIELGEIAPIKKWSENQIDISSLDDIESSNINTQSSQIDDLSTKQQMKTEKNIEVRNELDTSAIIKEDISLKAPIDTMQTPETIVSTKKDIESISADFFDEEDDDESPSYNNWFNWRKWLIRLLGLLFLIILVWLGWLIWKVMFSWGTPWERNDLDLKGPVSDVVTIPGKDSDTNDTVKKEGYDDLIALPEQDDNDIEQWNPDNTIEENQEDIVAVSPEYMLELEKTLQVLKKDSRSILNKARLINNADALRYAIAAYSQADNLVSRLEETPSELDATELEQGIEKIRTYITSVRKLID